MATTLTNSPKRSNASGDGARDLVTAVVLAGLVLVLHVVSPIRTSFDSRWSIHTSVSLAYRGDADLDEYAALLRAEEDYGIERRGDRRYSRYPVGPSLMAIPVVLVYDVLARLTSRPTAEDLIAQRRAVALEVGVASLIVALTTGVIYLTARRRRVRWVAAALLALAFAFCTPAWSTASRGLWQHGPSMLVLASAVYLMLLARRRPGWVVLAALPLGFGFLIRPTNAIALAIFTAYVAIRHPRQLVWFVLLWACVLGAFGLVNLSSFGALLPSYFLPSGQPIGAWSDLPWVLAGHLVSPNRGLFVFSPILLLALAGLIVQVRRRTIDPLDIAVLAVLSAYFVAISLAGQWWAGHSFGPRFTTDVLPLLAYFTMPAVLAVDESPPRVKSVALAIVTVLAAWSLLAHLRAATTWDVWAWNGAPVSIDDRPERAWDWSDLQILRGLGSDRSQP